VCIWAIGTKHTARALILRQNQYHCGLEKGAAFFLQLPLQLREAIKERGGPT
jgi:hypothetical protein